MCLPWLTVQVSSILANNSYQLWLKYGANVLELTQKMADGSSGITQTGHLSPCGFGSVPEVKGQTNL